MGFSSLSNDLFIHIMCDIHVLDVLSLRQTCRALQHASYERIIWLKQLQRSCRKNHIFLPTFPFDDMTSVELERASLAPHRSLRAMTRGPTTSKGFAIRHNVRKAFPGPIGGTSSHASLFLVPGGRFLLYSKETKIILYDLGYPGCPPSPHSASSLEDTLLTPLAACDVERGIGDSVNVYPACNGEALRILRIRRQGLVTLDFVVLEIYPQNPQPTFVEIHRFVPDQQLSYLVSASLRGDDLFIMDDLDQTLQVHNIKNHSWTWWKTCPNVETSRDYQEIIVRSRDVLAVHLEGVDIWPYPILENSGPPMFTGDPPSLPPAFSFTHPERPTPDYTVDDECPHILSEWYSAEISTSFMWDKPHWSFPAEDEPGANDNPSNNLDEDRSDDTTDREPERQEKVGEAEERSDSTDAGGDYTDEESSDGSIIDLEDAPSLDVHRYTLKMNTDISAENRPLDPPLDDDKDSSSWDVYNLSEAFPVCKGNPVQMPRLCEGAVVSLWGREGKPVYVNVHGMPSLDNDLLHVPLSTRTLPIALHILGDSFVPDHSTFCPFSGRLAYTKWHFSDVDTGTVTVFDLF